MVKKGQSLCWTKWAIPPSDFQSIEQLRSLFLLYPIIAGLLPSIIFASTNNIIYLGEERHCKSWVSINYPSYTCQLFFSKMHEIFCLHRIWISKDLLTASEGCQRFRKTYKDRQRFSMTSQDVPPTSEDNYQRWRKIFDDFKKGPAAISKGFPTNHEHC